MKLHQFPQNVQSTYFQHLTAIMEVCGRVLANRVRIPPARPVLLGKDDVLAGRKAQI